MSWDEQWTDEQTIQKWLKPSRKLVRTSSDLHAKGLRQVLDLGCGVGRHVVFLAKNGWEVHATDSSQPAVAYCQKWLAREGLTATVLQKDMTRIPYPDGFFEFIVAFNVIYHTTFAGMLDLVQLIRRKLRPGGYFLVTLKSTNEWIYGQGQEIEKNTFLRPRKRVPVHFSTEEEIGRLFGDFELVSQEYRDHVNATSRKRHAFWEIVLRKPRS